MLHTLSTTTADLTGFVEIDATLDTNGGELARRVSRIATLDGGAVVSDGGYSDADRIIEIRWPPRSAEHEASIQRLLRSYTRLQVASRDGCFLAVPESYTPGADESTLRLLVIEKLSA